MNPSLTHIWRHPIKAHGSEQVERIALEQGQTMPWDRRWAVAHTAAKTDGTTWAHCANFSRGAKTSDLMAISATSDEAAGTVTLRHPDLPALSVDPDKDGAALIAWAGPLMTHTTTQSSHVVRVNGRGMTDTPFASISLLNTASNRALEQKLGMPLDMRRWRGNLWIEGLAEWEEFTLIGKTLKIGDVLFRAVEPITRCLATTANPETGKRDADTLGGLEAGWGHKDFGIYLEVTSSGILKSGDTLEVIT
ncbi:MAG: hypothetical protein ACJA1E_000855 [Paracoccaceae bacterium]|jgi:uncharacterized protein YcbX